jgi:hypothetical protein
MSTFEYRKLLRANILLKVLYKTRSWPLLEGVAYSKNIGTLGLNIIVGDKLEKNAELVLQVFLPGDEKPVLTIGKVIWQYKCSYIPESKRSYYSTGIQFGEMAPDDAVKASDFIRNILKTRSDAEVKKIIDMIENIKYPRPPAGGSK